MNTYYIHTRTFKVVPLLKGHPVQFYYLFSLCYQLTLLSRKNLTSTSLMASTAAFSLKQMYTVNLLNLMSADTEMEDSRIMNFFSEVLH